MVINVQKKREARISDFVVDRMYVTIFFRISIIYDIRFFVFRYPFVSIPMCSRYISLYPSFILRLPFVHSSIVLRSFFDSRTEIERRSNGDRTEDQRRMNGERTENERRTMRRIYHRNCWAHCNTVSLLIIFQELIKVDFGTYPIDNKNQQNHVAHLSDFNLPPNKIKDEI